MNTKWMQIGMLAALPALLAGRSSAGEVKVELKRVASGFEQPLDITHAGDGSGRLFIAEHDGVIRILLKDGVIAPKPFLDLSEDGLKRVSIPENESDERGLLGIAFHPRYKENGRFFVNYTREPDDQSIIAEYRVSSADPNLAGPDEKIILGPVKQPQWNHNGGGIAFGPDGCLYIGMGDGGFRDDMGPGHNPKIGNGQDTTTLLGKMLRIDVDHPEPPLAYGIPKDNPFADEKAEGKGPHNRREIHAYGLRNPWRFSFDRRTGRLFCGDVGQKLWEEINIIERGGNYGWRLMEGNHCFNPSENCEKPGLVRPIHEYDHNVDVGGGLSVTGGYVYRGSRFPALDGLYFFADYSSGRIWTLREETDGRWTATEQLRAGFYIPTFGEDEDGEIYLCDKFRGDLYQVVAVEDAVAEAPKEKRRLPMNDKGKVVMSDEEWRKILTPDQFHILRGKGTECAFTGAYWDEHRDGYFTCAGCGEVLFDTKTKFNSGTGWPSFWQPVRPGVVTSVRDTSHGMVRTEVLCARCDGHLGHVFEDGPRPTGLRFCINSGALNFVDRAKADDPAKGHE